MGSTLTIAGAFKPFQDVDVHAKVAGYIRTIYVDVGSHVKEGQTLAVLEVPELAAQLLARKPQRARHGSKFDGRKATCSARNPSQSAAHSAYVRLKQAADSRAGLVAQQEVDDSQAKDLAGAAQVQARRRNSPARNSSWKWRKPIRNNTPRFRITRASPRPSRASSPFATRIPGALIAAGTSNSTQSMPVVRLAQTSVLRLVLPIPESIAAQIRVGET